MAQALKVPNNRIGNEINRMDAQKKRFAEIFGDAKLDDPIILKNDLQLYNKITRHFSHPSLQLSSEEKLSLEKVKSLQYDADKKLNGGFLAFLNRLFAPLDRQLTNRGNEYVRSVSSQVREVNHQLYEMGMSPASAEVERRIRAGETSFNVTLSTIKANRAAEFILQYRPDDQGQVVLNKINLTAHHLLDPHKKLSREFGVDTANLLTSKQMLNIAEGRTVFRLKGDQNSGTVFTTDLNDATANGYPRVKSYHMDDVHTLKNDFAALPFSKQMEQHDFEALFKRLLDGDKITANLNVNGAEKKSFVTIGQSFNKIQVTDNINNTVSLTPKNQKEEKPVINLKKQESNKVNTGRRMKNSA